MLIEIGCGPDTTRADLKDGVVKVGGGKQDEIRIPGLPPSLVTLRIEGERLTLTSTEPLTIGKSMFPSHVPRLVVAGERVQLARNVTVQQVAPERRAKGTATVMKDLIAGTCAVDQTQAPTLTVLTGGDAGSVVPLAFEEILIGRGQDCDIQIRDTAVSRRHARLRLRDSRASIEDLRGHNGTFVNGRRVERRAPLTPGDVIELGKTLLRFNAPINDEATPPSPPSVVVEAALAVTEPEAVPASPQPRWVAPTFAGGAVAIILGVAAALSALF
jgi:hypothetical protein